MWERMGLVRVYTKKTGKKPDFDEPVAGLTIVHFISLN
jgi:ribosome-interacting GTPase 1